MSISDTTVGFIHDINSPIDWPFFFFFFQKNSASTLEAVFRFSFCLRLISPLVLEFGHPYCEDAFPMKLDTRLALNEGPIFEQKSRTRSGRLIVRRPTLSETAYYLIGQKAICDEWFHCIMIDSGTADIP